MLAPFEVRRADGRLPQPMARRVDSGAGPRQRERLALGRARGSVRSCERCAQPSVPRAAHLDPVGAPRSRLTVRRGPRPAVTGKPRPGPVAQLEVGVLPPRPATAAARAAEAATSRPSNSAGRRIPRGSRSGAARRHGVSQSTGTANGSLKYCAPMSSHSERAHSAGLASGVGAAGREFLRRKSTGARALPALIGGATGTVEKHRLAERVDAVCTSGLRRHPRVLLGGRRRAARDRT